MKLKTKYFGGIDIFKHILALCVVFLHMGSENRFSSEELEMHRYLCGYVQGTVAGFFLISGFLFCPDKSIFIFVKKKFKRLMMPFFIFSLLYALLMTSLGKYTLLNGFKNTLFLNGVGPQTYFLPYLFFISLLYFVIEKISNIVKVKFVLILFIICVILISCLFPTDALTGPGYRTLIFYCACFGVGVVISKFQYTLYSYSVFLIIFCAGFYDFRYFHVSVLIIILMLAIILSKRFNCLQKSFSGSGGVYILHQPITSNAISTFLVFFGIGSYCNMFVSWGITYLFCLLLTLLLIRFLPSKKWILLE